MISVFGSTGFIGGNYCRMYPDSSVTIPRDGRSPKTEDILYFISTTHNYNVFDFINSSTLMISILSDRSP